MEVKNAIPSLYGFSRTDDIQAKCKLKSVMFSAGMEMVKGKCQWTTFSYDNKYHIYSNNQICVFSL